MNRAYPVGDRAGGSGSDRLERELRSWLRSFDPGGLEPSQRLWVYQGLGAEASLQQAHRTASQAIGQTARLGIGIAGCALIVAAWLALGMTANVAGPGAQLLPSMPQVPAIPGSDTINGSRVNTTGFLALLAAAAVLGAAALVPVVRRGFARVFIGNRKEPATDPRPLREWRSIPWPAWTIVGAAVAYQAWWLPQLHWLGLEPLDQLRTDAAIASTALASLVAALAAPVRYRFCDRSSWLLALGILSPIPAAALVVAIPWGSFDEAQVTIVLLAQGFAISLGPFLLAAAVGRRSGGVRRPPVWLVTATLAVLVAVVYSFAADADWTMDIAGIAVGISNGLPRTLTLIGWLTAAWIGLDASRRSSRPWPWRLLAIGSLGAGVDQLAMSAIRTLIVFSPGAVNPDNWYVIWGLDFSWLLALLTVVTTGVAAGLLAGLRRPEISVADVDRRDVAAVRSEVLA
jgi:hypothetical protein